MLVTGLTLSKVVNYVNEGRVKAIPEGETELKAVRVSGLLNKCLEGVNVFIKYVLPLTILVLILQRKSHSLGGIEGEEFCLEIGLEGCPVHEAVYPTWMSEHPEHVDQCMAGFHV